MTATAGKRLLIGEDNDVEREGLGIVLRREGYRVVLAADGREGLGRLRDGPAPDLILLDMIMPVVDGWQVLKELGQDDSLAGIPVIVMTVVRAATLEWARGRGAAGYVGTPFDMDEL